MSNIIRHGVEWKQYKELTHTLCQSILYGYREPYEESQLYCLTCDEEVYI